MKKSKQNDNTIGNRLKKLRVSKQWTQDEFSKIVSLDSKQISKYESNRILPGAESLIALSKAFGVTIDYILLGDLKGEAANRFDDREFLELFSEMSKLDEKQKMIAKEVLKGIILKNNVEKMKF